MAFDKIKKSQHREDIEKMLVQGVSPRKISSWLENKGEQISYLSIHQYKQQEFNYIQAAVDEMELSNESSEEIFDAGKRSVMADIGFCNRVIEIAEKKINELDSNNSSKGFKIFVEAGLRAIDMKLKISGVTNNDSHTINLNQINIEELKIGINEQLREIEELQEFEIKSISGK